MKQLLCLLSMLLLTEFVSAQVRVDNSPLSPVAGPGRRETLRSPDSTSVADTTAASMSTTDAQAVYSQADKYYGRSNWSSIEFDSVMKETGIDSRDGQHAAIASILIRMRDGDTQGARARLDTLYSMPGYVIDNDIAQILSAIDVILNAPKQVDTVYVNNPNPSVAEARTPDRANGTQQSPMSDADSLDNAMDTTAAVQPDRGSERSTPNNPIIPSDAGSTKSKAITDVKPQMLGQQPENVPAAPSDTYAGLMAAFEARLRELEGKVSDLSTQMASAATDPQESDAGADDAFAPSSTARFTNEWPEEYITRRCYTIEIERHTSREVAERQINNLRRIYKRVRLAIEMSSDQPFVVIVGYYRTERSAVGDVPTVSRTTRRACKVMETTIAEKL